MKLFSSSIVALGIAVTCSMHVCAQAHVKKIHELFQESNTQWLCRELVNVYPDYFARPHPEIIHPFTGPVKALDITVPSSMTLQLDEVFFPDNQNKRFLLLESLSDLYSPLFEKKLVIAGLPREYLYLPMVISGLNQHYERTGDEGGLWGLTYLVARKEHLRVDALVDERKGADFTTDAAIRYLVQLHKTCGDDHLKTLLAFYHSVPFLEENNLLHRDITLDDLDAESRFFVSLFVYANCLFDSIETENQLQLYFDILGNYESIFLTQDAELAAFKEVLNVDLANFHASNPVYTGNRIEGTYRRVPFVLKKEEAVLFRAMEDSIYRWKPRTPPVPVEQWVEEKIYYKVKRGDSLGKIAERHHVTVRQLKSWNGLKKDRINEGQRLLIIQKKRTVVPLVETPTADVQDAVNDNEPATPEGRAGYPITEEKVINHKVKQGESLWLIAKKYPGTTPEMIMKWNNCSANIQPGQMLKIYAQNKK